MNYALSILSLVSCLLLYGYTLFYSMHHGLPYCLSETHYHTPKKWYFPVFMVFHVALLTYPLLECTAEEWQFLCFFLMTSMIGVAVSPFRDSLFKYRIHYVSSLIAMLSMSVLQIVNGFWVFIPIVLVAFILIPVIFHRPLLHHWLLFLELAVFHLAYAYILIHV